MKFSTSCLVCLFSLAMAAPLFAANQTLTSYYPSPQGNYKNLDSQTLTVNPSDGGKSTIIGSAGCGAPWGGLSVQGVLSGCTNYSLLGDGTNLYINRLTGGYIFFRENNGNGPSQMTIKPGGNVGIGIDSPGALLHVRSTAATGNQGITTGSHIVSEAGSGNNFLEFRNSSNNGTWSGSLYVDDNLDGYVAYKHDPGGSTDALHLGAFSNVFIEAGGQNTVGGKTTVATFNNSGKVGIKTTSPNYNLEVVGPIGIDGVATGTAQNYVDSTFSSTLCFVSGGACTAGAATPQIDEDWGLNLVGNSANHQQVRVQNAALEIGEPNLGNSDTTPAGDLLVSGSVGIGNTSPTLAGLQVDTAVGNTVAMFGTGTTGISLVESWPGVYFNSYWNGGWKFMGTGYAGMLNFNPGTGDMYMYLGNSGSAGGAVPASSTPIYAKNNGNVGIDNTNPSYTLDISGNVHATGTITADSDMRFKENIIPLTNVLPKIDRLKGVSFEWNHLAATRGHKEGEKSLGLIAQQLKKVYPELVQVDDTKHHYLSIDYEKFTAVLLESVKELKSEVDELKSEVKELKKQSK